MKQLMTSVLMYAQDYDECMVPDYVITAGWAQVYWPYQLLEPYTKNDQIWICPSSQDRLAVQRCDTGHIHVPANSICSAPLAKYKDVTSACFLFDGTGGTSVPIFTI